MDRYHWQHRQLEYQQVRTDKGVMVWAVIRPQGTHEPAGRSEPAPLISTAYAYIKPIILDDRLLTSSMASP